MALQKGDKAPLFTLKNTEGEEVALQSYQGSQNVVILFFPLAFTSVCTAELCQTRDNMKMYGEFNANVIGISVDSFFTLKEFKKMQNLNFDLLSDFNKEVAKSYDCLYEEFFGMHGVAKRSAFVVDKEGNIQYAEILESAGDLPNFQKIQETLAGLS